MILLVTESLLMPGLEHRIARRQTTLPPGFRLIVVTDRGEETLPNLLLDREGQFRNITGEKTAPLLISVDASGSVIDIVREPDTIHDWLWNEPRPGSLRVPGAVGLVDVTI